MPRKGFKLVTIHEEKHNKAKQIGDKEEKSVAKIVEDLIDEHHSEIFSGGSQ